MKRIRTGVLLALSATAVPGGAASVGDLNSLLDSSQFEAALRMMPSVLDLNVLSESGKTPLTVAGGIPTNDAYDMVHALLALGADPRLRNGEGLTALHYAAGNGILSVVHLLVDGFGADPDSPKQYDDGDFNHDETPVIWAAREGYVRIVRFLESRGAVCPERLAFPMLYKAARDANYHQILADTNIHKRPFLHVRVHVEAELLTRQEMEAPRLVVQWAKERIKAVEELAIDPEWQDRDSLDIFRESRRISWERMLAEPEFQKQHQAWRARIDTEFR